MAWIQKNIIYSKFSEEIYPDENIVEVMFKKFDNWSEREIMIDGVSGKSWTAEQFMLTVSKMAYSLANEFNVAKGDVVCFQCDNCDIVAIAVIATVAAGGVCTVCDSTGPFYELFRVVSQTMASYLIIGKIQLEVALQVAKDCGFIKKIFMIDDEQCDENHNVYPISCLLKTSFTQKFSPVIVDKDDTCVILFSSGTTGLPKPVPRTHRNLLANQNCNRDTFDFLTETDIVPLPWSLSHSSQMKLLTMSLLTGSKLVIFPDSGIDNLCNYFKRYKINKAILVPSYISQMVKRNSIGENDLSSLEDVLVTGSILSETMAAAFVKKCNLKYLRQLYGTTEVSTTVMQRKSDYSNNTLRCAGIPPPGYSVKIIDRSTGVALGPNCVGELCTKGPTVMYGFLNLPKENQEAFDEFGYYKTGDAAYYDINANIFIVDRYKNILKYEGGAISCSELEHILIKHPKIKDVSVIGVEDEVFGELPRAFIVVDHGELSSHDVIDFLRSHLSQIKQLHGGVVFLDSIPKSNFGKINRSALLAISRNR